MFYDQAKIYVKGGDGGNGASAFRREKYIAEGGPAGGDGGKGGDVIFVADEGLRTLVDFRYQRHYKAPKGEHGQGKNMHGAKGEDLVVRIPVGTVVKDGDTGEIVVDFTHNGQRFAVAKGGRGGRGNARFASSTNRIPTISEKGEPGMDHNLELELKLIADVGLAGFPNVGKSTLISVVSEAKPKIANYHFTTLVPNLGMVRVGETNFVMADIPGLVEGAHEGVGLGHNFLRHIERTRLVVHVLDIAGSEGRDPLEDFGIIQRELEMYKPELAKRTKFIAANKMDLPGAEENLERLKELIGDRYEIFPISAATKQGVERLVQRLAEVLPTIREEIPEAVEERKVTKARREERFRIDRDEEDVWVVSGREIERHVAMTNFDDDMSLGRFQQIFRIMGIEDGLRKAGAQDGDTVRIGELEFDFVD